MHFDLVDSVVERSDDRIVTIKQVSAAEEYLQDHFPAFPVLPGVMMVEALVQAGRRLLEGRAERAQDGATGGPTPRYVLGSARAVKYGRFVRPGETLRVEVALSKELPEGAYELKGEGIVVRGWEVCGPDNGEDQGKRVAVTGRLVLRPVRLG